MPSRGSRHEARRGRRFVVLSLVVICAVAAFAVASMAVAKSFTLKVLTGVHVTNTPTKKFRVKAVDANEAVAVGPAGYAVYTFQGETTHHIICKTTACRSFWPPVSPSSAKGISKQSGIKGKLGTFRSHGSLQLTLNGQPLYYFSPDLKSHNKHQATGDELKTFGSIWHVVKAKSAGGTNSASGGSQGGSTTSTNTNTNPYPYTY